MNKNCLTIRTYLPNYWYPPMRKYRNAVLRGYGCTYVCIYGFDLMYLLNYWLIVYHKYRFKLFSLVWPVCFYIFTYLL